MESATKTMPVTFLHASKNYLRLFAVSPASDLSRFLRPRSLRVSTRTEPTGDQDTRGNVFSNWPDKVNLGKHNFGLDSLGFLVLALVIDHNERDGGCRFYHNALRSEIIQKRRLISSL